MATHATIMYNPDLFGEEFLEAIAVCQSEKAARRMNKYLHHDDKLDIFDTELVTTERLPEVLKSLDPGAEDAEDDDSDSEDEDEDEDSDSDDDEDDDAPAPLPEVVWVATPVEKEENENIDIDYEEEIEVFAAQADAHIYAEARMTEPLFAGAGIVVQVIEIATTTNAVAKQLSVEMKASVKGSSSKGKKSSKSSK